LHHLIVKEKIKNTAQNLAGKIWVQ